MTTTMNRARNQEGFTLIELLITILIIGILAAIGLAAYNGQRDKAKDSQAQTAVRSALTAARSYKTINDTYYTDATNNVEAGIGAEESSLTFVTTVAGMPTGASADPKNVLVHVDSSTAPNRVQLCAASKSGKTFCIDDNNGVITRSSGTAAITLDTPQTGGAW